MKKTKAKQPSLAQMRMALANARVVLNQRHKAYMEKAREVWKHELGTVERAVAEIETHNERGEVLLLRWHIALLRQELKARAK